MAWFAGDNRTFFQKFVGNILISGPMPKHIGIIMDGNRRFAKSKNVEKIEGHKSGFEKLTEALSWCLVMNIKEISVYAFSIENFKRSKEEVDGLFDLARTKLKELLKEEAKMKKLGFCFRFFGKLDYLPEDLKIVISQIVEMTKDNKNFFFNLCFSYTSRDEMTTSIQDVNKAIVKKDLRVNDINEAIIEKALFTTQSFNVDLIIRTSGEVRLSDFLLWQSNLSVLVFAEETWPEFSIWGFYSAILKFQFNYKNLKELRMKRFKQREEFVKRMTDKPDSDEILKQINNFSFKSSSEFIELTKQIAFCSKKREFESFNKRKDFFLRKLISNRQNVFKSLVDEINSCNL